MMLLRVLTFLFLISIFGFPFSLLAEELPKSSGWTVVPAYSLYDELYYPIKGFPAIAGKSEDYKSELISTDALSWPDGRSALITYIKISNIKDDSYWYYRCVDFMTVDFQENGQMCYELRDPDKK